MGYMRTFIFLAVLTGLMGTVGFALGGSTGLVIALLLSGGMNFYSWYKSDQLALRAYRAVPADRARFGDYISVVEGLAEAAQLPMPRIYVLPGDQPNAFATGRNPENSAVAATAGLLRLMSREELSGVMAHELAHIKNRDTLISTVTATIAGALTSMSHWGFFLVGRGGSDRDGGGMGPLASILVMIAAPMSAALVQSAVSRTREYAADRLGGEICGDPLWLASALSKLESGAAMQSNPEAEANPATAHLFIINPLSGGRMLRLFSTHPSTESRIERLREQASQNSSGRSAAIEARSRGKLRSSISSGQSPRSSGYGGPWG